MTFVLIAACQHHHFIARLAGKERRKNMKNFAWAAHLGSLKSSYQRGYYCKESLYSEISLKV